MSDLMLGLSLPVSIGLAFFTLIAIGVLNLLYPELPTSGDWATEERATEDRDKLGHKADGQEVTPEARSSGTAPEAPEVDKVEANQPKAGSAKKAAKKTAKKAGKNKRKGNRRR